MTNEARPRFVCSERPSTGCGFFQGINTLKRWLCASLRWSRCSHAILLAGVGFGALAAGVLPVGPRSGLIGPPMAQAQNLGQRVVSGAVVDGNSALLAGATVFLKDLKTKSIRSYTSAEDGKFRFTQVNMAEDHELWAEKDGKKSAIKTVSSWDTRKEFVCELKVK